MKVVLLVVFIACEVTYASSDVKETPATVRAEGDAVVYVKPDQAKLDVGVVTQAATAQAAASENATQSQATLEKLRAAMGSKASVHTISYSVSPNYQFPREGKSVITSYTATDVLEITTTDLRTVGTLIDAATQNGANQIQNVQFGLQDQRAAQAQALREASLAARANAEAMAGPLGLKLGRVISMQQGTPDVIRPRMMFAANIAAASTPVEPGAIEIHASVTLTVALQ